MKNIKLELKWALVFAAMSLIWMTLERLLGFHDQLIAWHPIVTNFIAIPAILIFVLALRDKKSRDYDGQMSFNQGLISGLIIALIITILSPLTQTLTSLFITPDYFKNAIQYSVENNMMSQMDAEENFELSNYIVQGMIGAPIMGVITSAIIMIFIRSK